jgi:hypothetical protein
VIHAQLREEAANAEADDSVLKHGRDCRIIKAFIEDTDQQSDTTKLPEVTVPPVPKLAEKLSLRPASALQAMLDRRRLEISWWC